MKYKSIKKVSFLVLFLVLNIFIFNLNIVNGIIVGENENNGGQVSTENENKIGKVSINNPIGSNDKTNINEIIGKIIKGIMGVIGTLALVMFVFGGFMWMTSAGNSERVEKAKSIIVWNILGIIAIFSAYAIINFVLDSLK